MSGAFSPLLSPVLCVLSLPSLQHLCQTPDTNLHFLFPPRASHMCQSHFCAIPELPCPAGASSSTRRADSGELLKVTTFPFPPYPALKSPCRADSLIFHPSLSHKLAPESMKSFFLPSLCAVPAPESPSSVLYTPVKLIL